MMSVRADQHTLSIMVNNKSGVLMRVVSLFSRRGYNIDSLSVGETENPKVSRITVVVTGDERIIEQISRQLEKLADVIRVFEMKPSQSLIRELVLIKVNNNEKIRGHLVEIGEIFKAKIIDVTTTTMTFVLTGTLDKIDSFEEMIGPYGVVEMARTGVTALERGSRSLVEIGHEEDALELSSENR